MGINHYPDFGYVLSADKENTRGTVGCLDEIEGQTTVINTSNDLRAQFTAADQRELLESECGCGFVKAKYLAIAQVFSTMSQFATAKDLADVYVDYLGELRGLVSHEGSWIWT